ncbi:DMT family transporter [Rhizobium sp. 16-488-2b]|nr:DMT family transporter [Rhizobium sp. 16-488-2b]MBO9177732.1 DMT family transporter [Rhizobium sp. 16-488-2a]
MGMLLMLAAVSTFSLLDASGKRAAQDLPVIEVTWFRFAIHFLIVALVLNPWTSSDSWKMKRPGLQMVRGLFQAGSAGLSFLALSHLAMAQALSIQFTTPILVALLSIVLLGERVAPSRWLAIIIGFAGVVIVSGLWHGIGYVDPAIIYSLGSVTLGAFYIISTRRLAPTESVGSMLLMMGGLPALVLTPMVMFVWETPDNAATWMAVIGVGLFGALGHGLLILAHRYADASALAPVQYAQLIAASIVGFALFGEVPSVSTLVGAVLLVASGFLAARAPSHPKE